MMQVLAVSLPAPASMQMMREAPVHLQSAAAAAARPVLISCVPHTLARSCLLPGLILTGVLHMPGSTPARPRFNLLHRALCTAT